MDDFTTSSLHESRNEWCARLLTILTPLVIQGFNSIFDEACKLCASNDEHEKYLMTFQNFISRIPKWNETIIDNEHQRILDKSNCNYLGDLLSCVHIIQLKLLTCVRAGKKQKNINIDVPPLPHFLHKIYINVARKLYTNIYLYEVNVLPLQKQKHNRELEIIVQEGILNTIRENMPIEDLLKAYLDESIEEDVTEEIVEKPYDVVENEIKPELDKIESDTKPEMSLESNVPQTPSTSPETESFIQKLDATTSALDNPVKVDTKPSISFDVSDVESEDNEVIKISDENAELDLDVLNIDTDNDKDNIVLDFEEI
jgi:hypothetical protein